jgi:hypothetical protein
MLCQRYSSVIKRYKENKASTKIKLVAGKEVSRGN